MILMLGVAKALKAMHQYRVKTGAASTREARAVRGEGEAADEGLSMQKGKPKRRSTRQMEDDVEQEPLMDNEVTRSQEGIAEGDFRPYAHRDIKPGMLGFPFCDLELNQ
jgi:serine/threonine kinase 16